MKILVLFFPISVQNGLAQRETYKNNNSASDNLPAEQTNNETNAAFTENTPFDYVDGIGVLLILIALTLVMVKAKKRKTKLRAWLGGSLVLISIVIWLHQRATTENHTDNGQRALSILILIIAIVVLASKRGKRERRAFPTEIRREVLQDQDYKCALCGKYMKAWERDFDHIDANRSNNKISNCRALHTSCHRKMHAEEN